jgi:hypothetical protein
MLDSVTVTANDFDTLIYVSRRLCVENLCVAQYLYTGREPLTETQLKKLPKAAREKLAYAKGAGDTEEFLEALYCLDDPRD